MALEEAGFEVIALGALTPAEDFVKAAIETAADAILVSSIDHGPGAPSVHTARSAASTSASTLSSR